MKPTALFSGFGYARGGAIGFAMLLAGLTTLAAEAWSQSRPYANFSATTMGHSSEVTVYTDYVTIYGKPGRKTYLYQNLGALPFRKFTVQVVAAGESGDNRWPRLGLAFGDTTHPLKEVLINSTAFQSYDLGVFEAPPQSTIYLIFMNDYYNPATGGDVNLKIGQAVLTATTKDTAIVRGRKLTLRWDRNREADLRHYRIYYSSSPGQELNQHVEVDSSKTSHVFDVELGKNYFYSLAAYDTANNSSALSPEIMARVLPDTIGTTADLNGDNKCDAADKALFKNAFGSTCTDAKKRYNPRADFNSDCKIDARDQVLFTKKCK
ncbi:MAG: dockerin type I domain-containing protein [candidate division KSB1 bacterium]